MSRWRILTEAEVLLAKLIPYSAEHGTTETAQHSEALAELIMDESPEAIDDTPDAFEAWGFDAHGAQWRVRLIKGGES